MSMGYKKDIFTVFAYEFEPSRIFAMINYLFSFASGIFNFL